MKKTYLIISLLLVILLAGCSNQSNLDNNEKKSLTDNASSDRLLAQKIAWSSLSEEEINSIPPWKQATVAKVNASKIPFLVENVKPTNVYKVTYLTEKDELLGPIGIYVDVDETEIVGFDVRQ